MSDQKQSAIIVQQEFSCPRARVWQAITDPIQMRQWFFEAIPSFQPQEGFETQFNVQAGDKNFLHHWKLTEVIPQQKIRYHWAYPDYPGNSFVNFELSEKNQQTLLRVSHEGMESLPQEIEEFSRASCRAGWEYFIQGNLKKFLEEE